MTTMRELHVQTKTENKGNGDRLFSLLDLFLCKNNFGSVCSISPRCIV